MSGYLTKCNSFFTGTENGLITRRIIFSSFLLFYLLTSPGFTQTIISEEVINSYSSVLSIDGTQAVTVSQAGLFNSGDTVLIIQMKGMGILTNPPEDYGRQQNINASGNYEFLLVDQVNVDDNTISFTREFLKEYNASGVVQLVKVRGYESAKVTSTLSADAWDGEKGGILAMIVTNTLTLEADIDLTGKGFRGGSPAELSADECSSSDPEEYEKMSFPPGIIRAGRKGEGPATYYIDEFGDELPLADQFIFGRGRIATGGGGGNGRFSGGGGGSNYGQGSFGGAESVYCTDQSVDTEGMGGYRLADQLLGPGGLFVNRFFMGGGGGGSTQHDGRVASAGGNGGGMVIIIANYIEGTDSYGIYADGGSVSENATAGAGGGGGGGTIVTSVDNYSGNINLYVRGGKGGDIDHPEIAGPGGGGGGGSIIFSGMMLPDEVKRNTEAGAGGINLQQNDPHGSAIGSPGGEIEELEISLNGLLFNGISIKGDIICEDTAPDLLEGTQPRGGIQPYNYQWFKKTAATPWTIIDGADTRNYQPGELVETTKFLRVVKDQDPDPVIDSSNYITVTVQPAINGNTISGEQTICEGDTPLPLSGEVPYEGGTGSYEYQWIESTAGSGWSGAVNENNLLGYSPSQLFDSTSFIRVATSGACIDSSNIIPVNVHPLIANNILDDDQVICHGDAPLTINAPQQASGGAGAGSYVFVWEMESGEDWNPISGSGNTASYEPEIPDETVKIRRTVTSGACTDTSPPHTITVLPLITGNIIEDNQIICYMDRPELFTGSEPSGGDGSYTYKWESSGTDLSWVSDEEYQEEITLHSPALSEPLHFRRIVYSGQGDACKDTSNMIFVDLHPFSYAEIVESFDTICVGEQPELSFHLSGEGPWDIVFSNGTDDYTATGITNEIYSYSIDPYTVDSITHQYQVTMLTDRFGCNSPAANLTGTAKVRVYAYPEPDPGNDGEACGLVYGLNATPGIVKGIWETTSAGALFSPDNDLYNASVTVTDYGSHQFRWIETNWRCTAGKETTVTFFEPPAGIDAGEDQNLTYDFDSQLEAELPGNMPSASGIWALMEGSGNVVFPDSPGSMVTDLGFGENIFMWTVTNGVCAPVSDLVKITINDLVPPTGISPNNSGLNDRFVIRGLENSQYNELTIFNRQGNAVYKTNNYLNDWEGRNQDGLPLPEDTYYYILNVDNSYSYKGFILLKR